MIKINLAKKKKTGSSLSSLGKMDVGSLLSMLKSGPAKEQASGTKKRFDINQPIPKLIIMLALCWVIDDTLTTDRAERLAAVDKVIAQTNTQVQETRAKLNKIKGYEPIKKHMEEDEREVRTKLEVVKRLLEDRNLPSKMMMHISQAIPEEVWLTGLTVTPASVKFSGATPGYNQVSDFIKALKGATDYTDVGLSSIQEAVSSKERQKFQVFELVAKRRSAL